MGTYGDTATIKTRTGATPEDYGLADSAALDSFIMDLQERASSLVERYTGQLWDEHTNQVDIIESTGREHISTRHDPVLTINSVTEGEDTLVEDEDFRLVEVPGMPDENIGRLKRIDDSSLRTGRRWWPNVEIEIDYDWGYTDATRPAVIDHVVEDLVVSYLNEALAERKASGVKQESMDGFSVTYALATATDRMELTEQMQASLDSLTRQGSA